MAGITEEDLKYDPKRTFLVILIVAVVLLVIFVFWPFLIDWVTGDVDTTEPSERLHGYMSLIQTLNFSF